MNFAMDMEMIKYSVLGLFALIVIISIWWYIHNLPENVTQEYTSSDGKFNVKGRKNKFTICKDDKIEFLVEEGEIVALRDKSKGKDFIYYKERA